MPALSRTAALALAAVFACVAACRAQDGPTPTPNDQQQPAPDAVEQQTLQLIDAFHGSLPRSPADLRRADVRARVAPKALPVLRRIRAFAGEHPGSTLGRRRDEFTLYAVVLGDAEVRAALQAKADGADRDALLLLRAADVVLADDAEQRAAAVKACAAALRGDVVDAAHSEQQEPSPSERAPCIDAVAFCLSIAAELSADEARELARHAPAGAGRDRLRAVAESAERDPRRLIGAPFAVEGTQLDGATFSTRSLRGKVVLVDFWASWCAPCVRKLPDLLRLLREKGTDNLAIVGVSCDRDERALRAFLAEHDAYDWPQLFAKGTTWHPLATAHGVTAIPRVFLIDRQGVLRSVDAAADLDALVRRYVDE